MTLSAPIYRLKRRAKALARESGIPLHAALDQLARAEGYTAWSHLSAKAPHPAPDLYGRLRPGDLLLVAARPGHGKTLLGLELAVAATHAGQAAHVFSLDYHDGEVLARLRDLGADPVGLGPRFHIDTSDDICADHILRSLIGAPKGTLAVVDYLQLLDQNRRHPELNTQLRALSDGAKRQGLTFVILSQIDRAYELTSRDLPGLDDIRLPNPVDLRLFTAACFLQDGRIAFNRPEPTPA